MGGKFLGKKHYVTLEWPHTHEVSNTLMSILLSCTLFFVLQAVGHDNAGHLDCMMDTLQTIADYLPHWLVKPHIVVSHIRTIVDFLVANVRVPSPKISSQDSRPITVIEEQWRDMDAYFEQNA